MAKKSTIVNKYRNKYAKLRKLANFNFKFDLRNKSDSKLTKGQKAQITRAERQLSRLENVARGLPVAVVKVRHLKGESEPKYRKRVAKLQKSQNQKANILNLVSVPVVKGEKVKIVGSEIVKIKKRKGSDREITEWQYPLSLEDSLQLLEDPNVVLKKYLKRHLDRHPTHKQNQLLIGFDSNGFAWKLGAADNMSYLARQVYADIVKYNVIGDDAGAVIGKVIVRRLNKGFGTKKRG